MHKHVYTCANAYRHVKEYHIVFRRMENIFIKQAVVMHACVYKQHELHCLDGLKILS